MQHDIQIEGFGVRLRPVRMEDAPFIVWLRNLEHARGRVGDSASTQQSQETWLQAYFQRAGDYYFIVETPGGIPVGTLAIGKAGAINAALLASAILGAKHRTIRESLRAFRIAQTKKVLSQPDPAAAARKALHTVHAQLSRK